MTAKPRWRLLESESDMPYFLAAVTNSNRSSLMYWHLLQIYLRGNYMYAGCIIIIILYEQKLLLKQPLLISRQDVGSPDLCTTSTIVFTESIVNWSIVKVS
jgi:hypothetical protein